MPMLDKDSLWLRQNCLACQESSRVSLVPEQAARTQNPDLGSSRINRDHEAIDKIKAAILSHGNPIAEEGDKLYNMITHAYIPQVY